MLQKEKKWCSISIILSGNMSSFRNSEDSKRSLSKKNLIIAKCARVVSSLLASQGIVLNFCFLSLFSVDDLASVVTASVMLPPRVTRRGLRIVTGLEVGIVWRLFLFFSWGNDVFPVLWKHRRHNTALHFYPSALSLILFQCSNTTLLLPGWYCYSCFFVLLIPT